MFSITTILTTLVLVTRIVATPVQYNVTELDARAAPKPPNCFPAIGFKMPSKVPSSRDNWWCDKSTEYGFMGFSYEVNDCLSVSQLKKEFTDIRKQFNGRYVRLYGFCDRKGFYNDVIEAAWHAGIGVHALIWFGFDGDKKWVNRRDALWKILHTNPKAPFVTRVVQFGSEPLFDGVMAADKLSAQVWGAKAELKNVGIPVTISEMAYGYQKNDPKLVVMDGVDLVDAHILPFFSWEASTAKNSWPIVKKDLDWFVQNAKGKKIYLSQTGWPSKVSEGVKPNNKNAVANRQNEEDYYNLLNSKCSYFKSVKGGGVGWFAHMYHERQYYGIYDANGKLKFPFKPKTSC